MKRNYWKKIVACFAVALCTAAILFSTTTIFAEGEGESGSADDAHGGSCAPSDATSWFDTCYGVSWRKYPVTSDSMVSQGSNHTPTIYINGCQSIGATEYYLLAYEVYNPQTMTSLGRQRSGVNVSSTVPGGGSIPFQPVGVPWSEAEGNWNIAKNRHGISFPTVWANTSWFCWNPAWGDCETNPDDPACQPHPTEDEGDGRFWAESWISVKSAEYADTHTSERVTTKKEDTRNSVTIRVSTDSSADITFNHEMFNDDKLGRASAWDATKGDCGDNSATSDANDEFTKATTELKIEQTGPNLTKNIRNETYTAKPYGTTATDVSASDKTITVSPNPGESIMVCQVLEHTSKQYTITQTHDDEHHDAVAATATTAAKDAYYSHTKYKFGTPVGDGLTGRTQLCAEVYRPSEPGGDRPVWTKTNGDNNGSPMYAGETSEIGWNTFAQWQGARQVEEFRAIAFTVPSDIRYSESILKGNIGVMPRVNSDPCAFYQKAGWNTKSETWCQTSKKNDGGEHDVSITSDAGIDRYRQSQGISLEDYVGFKYCTAAGYRWQAFYAITYNTDPISWIAEGSPYWTNYSASCRTIAKKPSSAFWNSGVITNGGILTSLSPRINGVGKGDVNRDFTHLYGSWTEHLAVIGGITKTFGSGSSIARGSNTRGSRDISDWSPMTISNTETDNLGHSGISTSAVLRNRLETYLKNNDHSSLTTYSSLDDFMNRTGGTVTGGNHIIKVSGDLKIDKNIIISSANSYNSIYNIPQVVIFVDGEDAKIDIKGSVTEIDAWIIASRGILNTCYDFKSKETQTASKYYVVNNVCDSRLAINGPVLVKRAELRRSYGSDPVIQGARYTPGEVFNLSAENYLWAYAQAGRYSSSYTEAYSRELAPRY